MNEQVSWELRDGVALVTVNNPPVNALGHKVRQGLDEAIRRAAADEAVRAVVITGAGRTFPAGADIREFGKPPAEPWLPEVVNHIEDSPKPVVAAIHGTALGGGLEVALGAHWRIAAPGAKVGLPEVLLGILPGAGGTQRLPRITGAGPALSIMLTGRQVPAAEAAELGIIDRIAEGDLVEEALAWARELADQGEAALRRTRERREGFADRERYLAEAAAARAELERKSPQLFAPFRIVECVEAAIDREFFDGLAFEREQFMRCMASPQREGLIHAFFAERRAAKIPEAQRAQPRPLRRIGVIGGGTMGSGISAAALAGGLEVAMVERDEAAAEAGAGRVRAIFERDVAKGRRSEAERDAILGRFSAGTDYAALADADLIIEAVFEDMDVKKEVFRRLDAVARPGAVLATNTSYLDVNEIASATSRPADVIGLHFFSPAHIMRLLEIVVADRTADDVVATGVALAKVMRKVPVRAGVCDGFIGNRILARYLEEASFIMEDGASPYEIDAAVRAFGYPMGPFQMGDLAGLDIGWATRKRKAATRDPNRRYVEIHDRICERGWFGQKTGKGFYIYPEGSRKGEPNPEVLAIIDEERRRKGITPRSFTPEEIMRRYMAAMINEAANVVDEGIALRPSDVDVVQLYGYGFPRWRGGPMKYADMYGLERLLADIREFREADPVVWQPAPLIERLVAEGRNFDSLNGE
ncbi:MAG: 3-hydroxyacyl-CoA dehydrogenase [Alphaproteobacteria bacterium]|nr:MAG: 3-hydroxyacyl-CoA dehydrogenase [Alphaproteobacteria bacterium]